MHDIIEENHRNGDCMSEIKLTLAAFSDEASDRLAGQITALKRNGLSHMEIRGVEKINCADLKAEQAKEIRKAMDDAGMKIKTVGSPIGKINITDDFDGEMEKFLRLTETAEILGAEKIRIFSFYRNEVLEEQAGQQIALARLRKLADRAGDLILCHENEKGIYGDGWEFCRTICREIPKIKAVFDPANFVQCGVDTLRAWQELKEYTEYLHLKDALATGVVVPCGDGIGNVPYILGDYLDRGGRFATLEPHLAKFTMKKQLEKEADETCNYSFADPDEAFDAAVAAVRKILDGKGVVTQ